VEVGRRLRALLEIAGLRSLLSRMSGR
jgi:hypothetical protein